MYYNFRYLWPLHVVLLLTNLLPDNVLFLRIRGAMIKPFLGSCGSNFRVGRNVTFYNSQNIHIGSNVYIAIDNWFNASEKIRIEDEVMFGPKSVITSSNHTKYNGSFRYGKPQSKPIVIGRGSWVSANCTITAGSEVNSGCLIASNSVVRGCVPKNSMYGGVPGKVIKSI
jgi:acetyltransferase-like isoleucine patch superfamily enzyme